MKSLLFALALLAAGSGTLAAVKGREVVYRGKDAELEGYLSLDPAVKGPRPGVLVVHDWMGISAETRRRCDMLAALGYVAFAADVYGKGIRPASAEEAAKLAGKYKGDRALYRERLRAALDQLRTEPLVDKERIAAIGYCFGGTGVLELARSGASVLGVVSFHGGLDSPHPDDGKAIRAKVLVLHGADDPFNPPAQIASFQEEMRKGGVDWQMVYYGGAVHSFTNPGAGADNSKGAAYSALADARSWRAMRDLLDEIFVKRPAQ
jgi:dienelactone hydrolase